MKPSARSLRELILYPLGIRAASRALVSAAFEKIAIKGAKVLDIGCGEMPLKPLIEERCGSYVGVDIEKGFYEKARPDVFGSAYDTTVEKGSIDIALSLQVFEHVSDPDRAMTEVACLLKPGGHLIASFPFSYPIHAAPYDYLRYSIYGFEEILKRHDFEIVEFKTIGGLCVIISVYLYNHFVYRWPFLPLGVLLSWILVILHGSESMILKMAGKDPAEYRSAFAANYVVVSRKTAGKVS